MSTAQIIDVLKFVIENYGLAGFALLFWLWHGWQVEKKLDKMSAQCNRMFGIMLAISDQKIRDDTQLNRGSFDDRSFSD